MKDENPKTIGEKFASTFFKTIFANSFLKSMNQKNHKNIQK